jgi:hypothetical protein
MSVILVFTRKWTTWYGVLRYRKDQPHTEIESSSGIDVSIAAVCLSFVESVRYGLWLARS